MKRIDVGETYDSIMYALVDDEDYPLLSRHKWYPLRIRQGTKVYAQRKTGMSGLHTELMHQLVMGNGPRGMVIDHINDDGLDNRKENLRWLPNSENIRRRYEDNPDTGIKLKQDKIENPWQAQVSVGGKTRHVGYFPTREAAKEARDHFIAAWLQEQHDG
jgi:hypothetical protein